MSGKKKDRRSTLADELDATQWDFKPGKNREILLRPVGSVFGDVPWEIQPQYLGPAPVAETETESDTDSDADEDVDTQPIEPLER
jgi:hypothetical protein